MKRLKLLAVLLLSQLLVLPASFADNMKLAELGSNAEIRKRVRGYFNISDSTPVTAETIRGALLNLVPIGSSLEEIYALIVESGMAADRFTYCYHITPESPADEWRRNIVYNHGVRCHINMNEYLEPKEFFRVATYYIIFVTNSEGILEKIDVEVQTISI